jgi:hypothetical protein
LFLACSPCMLRKMRVGTLFCSLVYFSALESCLVYSKCTVHLLNK